MELKNLYISKSVRLNKIVEAMPSSIKIFKEAGLDCIGCCTLPTDPLDKIMQDEGFSEQEISSLVKELEKLKTEEEKKTLQKPKKEDFELKEITEGNKKYYKLAGLTISERAYKNIHELADKKGLQIRLKTGGCSGYQYHYDYADKPEEDESTYELSKDISFYLNDFTFANLHGSVVDFKIGLHDSGLKIINPNARQSCSCGTSFGF